jgi:hypothetical protein
LFELGCDYEKGRANSEDGLSKKRENWDVTFSCVPSGAFPPAQCFD